MPAPAPDASAQAQPGQALAAAPRRRRRAGEPPRFTDTPNSQIRKIIAQVRSKQTYSTGQDIAQGYR